MSLAEITAGLLENGNLSVRFRGVVIEKAGEILAESAGTPLHAERLIWANMVVGGTDAFLTETGRKVLRIAMACDSTVQSLGNNMTDVQIEAAVTSLLGNADNLAYLARKSGLYVVYSAMQANGDVHNRFQASALKAAGTIFGEAAGTPLHAERLAWATKIFGQPATYLPETAFKMTKIGFATVQQIRKDGENVSDGQIDAATTAILADAGYLAAIT